MGPPRVQPDHIPWEPATQLRARANRGSADCADMRTDLGRTAKDSSNDLAGRLALQALAQHVNASPRCVQPPGLVSAASRTRVVADEMRPITKAGLALAVPCRPQRGSFTLGAAVLVPTP